MEQDGDITAALSACSDEIRTALRLNDEVKRLVSRMSQLCSQADGAHPKGSSVTPPGLAPARSAIAPPLPAATVAPLPSAVLEGPSPRGAELFCGPVVLVAPARVRPRARKKDCIMPRRSKKRSGRRKKPAKPRVRKKKRGK